MFTGKWRYTFLRVMGAMGIACICLFVFEVIAVLVVPGEEVRAKQFLTASSIISHVVSYFFLTTFFYFGVNIYHRFIITKRRFVAYFILTLCLIAAYALYNCISFLVNPAKMKAPGLTVPLLIFSIAISCIFMTGLALLIAYFTSLRDGQQQRKELEKQKMELEMENTNANLNFLKAQINPHFLHNTLNFLYAKSLPYSAELSEGILCLSDIMRYALNEERKDGKALLSDEIEHLENVIKINQFRFSNNLNVQFSIKGEVGGKLIVPFVLITLVENAFKHGDLKNRDNPIVIRLELDDKRLYFYCRNRKNPGSKEISTGIGLPNILKRLDFVYGDQYSYKVNDETDFYTTELTINNL